MLYLQSEYDYIADPHGAVGYLGLRDYLSTHPGGPTIFLETAHPIKFRPEVEKTLGIRLEIPQQIEGILETEKKAHAVRDYEQVKGFLLDRLS
jgi:threonine synthase